MQISVQIGLNWNWPTGTELGNSKILGSTRQGKQERVTQDRGSTRQC